MYRKYLRIGLPVLLCAVLFCGIFYGVSEKTTEDTEQTRTEIKGTETVNAGITASLQKHIFEDGILVPGMDIVSPPPEEQALSVYTFLQGPRAYREGFPWSGEWCEQIVSGKSFGGFGCGLCCMANIYSTLSPYECSPWDMYEFATSISRYYPSRESGAIGWEDMRMTLRASGIFCDLYQKPETYEAFQEQMKETESAVVLVSSANDAAFWTNTSGHYVNIWLYQEDTDMVFLAEPGDPENNRTWIPLRYVYDALKTVSSYQYLAAAKYSEGANIWKQNGIDDVWKGKYF